MERDCLHFLQAFEATLAESQDTEAASAGRISISFCAQVYSAYILSPICSHLYFKES